MLLRCKTTTHKLYWHGVRQVAEGYWKQGKRGKIGCKVICGATMTLMFNGPLMIMTIHTVVVNQQVRFSAVPTMGAYLTPVTYASGTVHDNYLTFLEIQVSTDTSACVVVLYLFHSEVVGERTKLTPHIQCYPHHILISDSVGVPRQGITIYASRRAG